MKRILMVALIAVAVGACAGGTQNEAARSTTTTARAQLIAALTPADSCSDLLGWIHDGARAQVGPYGLDAGRVYAADGAVGGPLRAQSFEGATTEAPMAAMDPVPSAEAKSADASASNGASTAGAGSVDQATGTNNQEAGVDELDRFKSDGHRVVMTDGQRLLAISLDGAAPTRLGELDLPMSNARLFLHGDHVLAVGDGASSNSTIGLVALVDVDLSAGAPRIAAQASVDGQLLDGRLADGTIRLVVSTPEPSHVAFVSPQNGDTASIQRALASNRDAVDRSTIDQWLPSWTPPGGSARPLLDCASVFHPHDWAGSSMLSVLSITDGLADLHPVGVVTDGQTIYASASALYVATQQYPTQQWKDDGTPTTTTAAPTTTSIHRFDITTAGAAAYQGSGTVAGTLLNQYSLSEQSGDLRVVTTTGSSYGGGLPRPAPCNTRGFACPMEGVATAGAPEATADVAPTTASDATTTSESTTTTTTTASTTTTSESAGPTTTDSPTTSTTSTLPPTTVPTTTTVPATPPANGTLLTVLALQGDQLVPVGRLDGLAPGEQVKTVRFLGDRAYIVTFRQYDPLFVVDLSDPTAPKLLGQLTTPGFSAYLHPVGQNLLFGVGTSISSNEPDGSKVALYDTSDPTHPTQLAGFDIPGQGTTLDSDPHAFTWDAERHLAFVATTVGRLDGPTKSGMMVYRIDAHSITWVGWIDHDAHQSFRPPATTSPSCPNGSYCPDFVPPAIDTYVPSSPVDRVIVVGDRVLAASTIGVSTHNIDTFRETAWIGW